MLSVRISFSGGSVVKNLPDHTGDAGLIPGSGGSLGGGNDNHSSIFTRKAMDGGVWWATAHGITKSWTQLSDWAHISVRTGQISVAPNNKHLFLFWCIGNVGILFPLRDVDFCHLENYWILNEMERGNAGFTLGIKWFCPKAICVTFVQIYWSRQVIWPCSTSW